MISLSHPPKVLEQKENKGVFEIEALYPGYGVTIGNSLRRVLLSSLEGAAITRAKIAKAPHEFSTLDGVAEDVVEIILNLKKLRFKLHTDEPQQAQLKVSGEKEAKGKDFETPSQLELVTKDLHIAQLTSKSSQLEIEIQVEKGVGYVPAESHKKAKEEIGSIALDSIFTPVQKVNYSIEQMRVGERTDFDRLTLEIETDGTISPEAAFKRASSILLEQYKIIEQGLEEEEAPRAQEEEGEEKKEKKPKKKAVSKKS